MPLPNPFRPATTRPSLKARAATLRANLSAPASAPTTMPAPGSEEAMAAFHAACHQHTIRTQFANEYPDLKRTPLEWWTADTLSKAMESGEITPAECARLYPLATERELRMAEIEHELKIGALHALAFADSYPLPQEEPPAPSADALTAAILDLWPVWAAQENGQEYDEALQARRFTLIDAADRLPATLENIAPKALALAWLEYVDQWRFGCGRSSYSTDGRLALDIHAAATAAPSSPEKAARPWPLDLIAAAGLDLKTMPLRDLIALKSTAGLLCDVTSAVSCQPRSMTEEKFNGAGLMVDWINDALVGVIEAAVQELRGRKPANRFERDQRLAALTEMTINNGDPNETEAFARELLAHAETERARG